MRISVCRQVFQLQQEKKKLQEDFSSLLQDREMLERRCATIQREQTQLGPRLEETKWEVSESQTLQRCLGIKAIKCHSLTLAVDFCFEVFLEGASTPKMLFCNLSQEAICLYFQHFHLSV